MILTRGFRRFGLPSNLVDNAITCPVFRASRALEIFLANAPFLRVDCKVNAGPTTDEESTLASVTFRGCDLPSSFSRGVQWSRASLTRYYVRG